MNEHDREHQEERTGPGGREAQAATLAPHATPPGEQHHEDPPYFLIWGVLFVLTLAEVGYAFLSLPKFWLALGLVVMALWKAVLVALYYMHLRFEPRRMWILAVSPLPLAVILVVAVITEFT